MVYLWSRLTEPGRTHWHLRTLFVATCYLMSFSGLLSINPQDIGPSLAEFGVRNWYVGMTITFFALTAVCSPLFRAFWLPMMSVAGGLVVALLCTDVFVSGAMTKPTRLGFSDEMVTRVAGEHYWIWLTIIRCLAAMQIASLLVRLLKNRTDGRDSNAAALLLVGLVPTYTATIMLSRQMLKDVPDFNAQPLVPFCCIVFVAIVTHVQHRRIFPLYPPAVSADSQRFKAIIRMIRDPKASNQQIIDHLKALGVRHGDLYVQRNGQAINLGNIADHAWCEDLKRELDELLALSPRYEPKKLF